MLQFWQRKTKQTRMIFQLDDAQTNNPEQRQQCVTKKILHIIQQQQQHHDG